MIDILTQRATWTKREGKGQESGVQQGEWAGGRRDESDGWAGARMGRSRDF